jgi:hypothetical protein
MQGTRPSRVIVLALVLPRSLKAEDAAARVIDTKRSEGGLRNDDGKKLFRPLWGTATNTSSVSGTETSISEADGKR